jgi:hypothetical protein
MKTHYLSTNAEKSLYGFAPTTLTSLMLSRFRYQEEKLIFDVHSANSSQGLRRLLEMDAAGDRTVIATRSLVIQLMQLLPPENTIVSALPIQANPRVFAQAYFEHQIHFNLESFVVFNLIGDNTDPADRKLPQTRGNHRKWMLFVRASANSMNLDHTVETQWNGQTKIFTKVIDADTFQKQADFTRKLEALMDDDYVRTVVIVHNASGSTQSVGRISQIRQHVDDVVSSRSATIRLCKLFIVLLAFPPETLHVNSMYPAVFLRQW